MIQKKVDAKWLPVPFQSGESKNGAAFEADTESAISVSGPSAATDTYTIHCVLNEGVHKQLRLEALLAPFADGQLGVGRNPRDPNFVLSD